MSKKVKKRLDELVIGLGLTDTISKAQALIMAGEVFVNGEVIDKAGTRVEESGKIELKSDPLPYVSRGGLKLKGAFEAFALSARDKLCVDVGVCTGGFTDLLLQEGASRVYAVDLGHGDIAWKLRQDERVVLFERTNAVHLESLPELVDLAVIDVSLISLRKVLPNVKRWLKPDFDLVALLKPQYEATTEQLPPGAVIKDRELHKEIIRSFTDWCAKEKLQQKGVIPSPVKGAGGNQEFLLWLKAEGFSS